MTAVLASVEVARLHGQGDIRVAREPAPQPASGEVALQVTAVGLCGSDLHWYQEAAIGDARLSLCLAIRFAGHGTTDGALRSQMASPERPPETRVAEGDR